MSALPGWMYGDPLEVAARKEEEAQAKARRVAKRLALNRARVRALVAQVIKKAARDE